MQWKKKLRGSASYFSATVCNKFHCNLLSGLGETTVKIDQKRVLGVKIILYPRINVASVETIRNR